MLWQALLAAVTSIASYLAFTAVTVTKQEPLNQHLRTAGSAVINSELGHHVEHLMDLWGIKGIALGVVRPDGEVEFGAWGNRTEDGEGTTPDVC